MSLRRGWLLAVALSLLLGFGFQGSRGLFETTEGRYAESAREMVESGRYLEPTLAGRAHWTKPPPVYWSIAAGLRIAGENAWGARLPNALAFVLTVVLVGALGRTLWDPRTGAIAALVYATSFFPVVAANLVSVDTLLVLTETAAMLAYARAFRAAEPARERRWVRAAWALFGVAFFVKGPPALLPLLALAAFGRVARPRAPRLLDAAGLALFVLLAGWWYAVSALRHPGLLGYFVGDEVVGRVMTDEHGRNPGWYMPFLIYLPVLLLGPGVWLAEALPAVRRWGLLRARGWAEGVRRGGPAALLALWLLLPLLVFSLARSRLPLYVLPLYVPLALGTARAVAARHPAASGEVPRRAVRMAVGAAAALLLLKAAAARFPSPSDMRALARELDAESPPPPVVWLFEEEKMFGLDFYRDGAVRRVTRAGEEPWADAGLPALLAGVERGEVRGEALLASPAWTDTLRRALEASPVAWSRRSLLGRDLYRVEPPPPGR